MKYLFYFVHPAKYHAFKHTINSLKNNGHQVDIVICTKDILEELIKTEEWQYVNIFPNGRRIKGLHIYLSALINLFRTIIRLRKFIGKTKYDLFVTDDLLTIIGKIKRVPTFFFTDDDISAVPESVILLSTAAYILSPYITNIGRYEKKKIGYYGFKALVHLHPNFFTPDREKVKINSTYFFIRCVSAVSTHDRGRKGIDNDLLRKIVNYLLKYGSVIINSERALPFELEQYRIIFKNSDITHYTAFAKIFISDSTTMCTEAAVLGVPALEINEWYSDFKQYKELSERYGLISGFNPADKVGIFSKIAELLNNENLMSEYVIKRKRLLEETIDVASFIYWILSEYPSSVKEYITDKNTQLRFK
jgi:uncharacterized protein